MHLSNTKILKDSLYKDVEAELQPLGFRRTKHQGLVRKTLNGFHRIRIQITNTSIDKPSFSINFLFDIRIDKVEELFAKYRHINPNDAKYVPTHTASLGQLLGNWQFTVIIESDKEIDEKFDDIERLIFKHALPYFEKYDQLVFLDKLYNECPQELQVSMKALPVRAALSLVLAKIVNRENWQALLQQLRKEFDHTGSITERKAFDAMVEELFI